MSYLSKSNDSFNTRLRFYLFYKVINKLDDLYESEFLAFDIDQKEDLILLYTAEYYQMDRKEMLQGIKVDEIYKGIEKLKLRDKDKIVSWRNNYLEKIFKVKFPISIHNKLVSSEICYYCQITKLQIKELASKKKIFKKNERGWNMEIDRKKPNKEYSEGNCVAACYWCNNAKTDEFNDIEFKPIAEGIRQVFLSRMK